MAIDIDLRIHPHDGTMEGIGYKQRELAKRDLDNLQAAYLLISDCHDPQGVGLAKAMGIIKNRIQGLQKDILV